MRASHTGEDRRVVRPEGESPGLISGLLNNTWTNWRRRGPSVERTMPVEGFTSRAETLFGIFEPTLSEFQVALAPFGCPVRLMPSGLGA